MNDPGAALVLIALSVLVYFIPMMVSMARDHPNRNSIAADETGEWEIVTRPSTTVGGKTVRARVQKVGEPAVTEDRVWSAHEKMAVRRP